MRITAEIAAIEADLAAIGTPERAAGEKRYLKSDLDFLGASVPQIRRQARSWLGERRVLGREELCRLVRALWRRRTHELRTFGVELLVQRVDQLTAEEMALAEWILSRANTWAHVDPLAIQVVGPITERFSEAGGDLDRWAADENFWLRRSVLLSHLLALRRGEGEWERFLAYADLMLEEREFFIRKAIGWVLRETGRVTPERVTEYLRARMDRVAGLTLREGVRHLPPVDRQTLLEAFMSR